MKKGRNANERTGGSENARASRYAAYLFKSNVVRLDGSDIVGINNPHLETFAMWNNAQGESDEA